jgi:perosamine synthetase
MQLTDLTIELGASVKQALEKIDANAQGVIFIVDNNEVLKGLLSDGDIRRKLLAGLTLDSSVSEAMNDEFFSLPVDTDDLVILKHITDRIKIIPLVDKAGRLVDYASINKIRRIAVAAPLLSGNELAYVTDCIKTNWISSQGKYVRKFEELFREYHNDRPSLAVSNGTVALHLALEALKIGKGDEVIVPDLTFAASVNAILYTGATPVLADIDPLTWNINIDHARKLVSSRTKAIMPVHLYGQPCDMEGIMQLAKEYNLLVIEDCAEALGSYYKGIPVGCFGDVATFSFYGNKTITTGEGGMVVFKNSFVAERAAMLRDHGMQKTRRYWHEEVGYNYRLTNIQAAIGVAQFERLNEFVDAKKKIAKTYSDAFGELEFLQIPVDIEDSGNSYWLYTMLVQPEAPFTRNELIEHLHTKGIETRPVFYTMHEMPPYQQFGDANQLVISSKVSATGISLPSSVTLTEEELEHICRSVQNFCKKTQTPVLQ